MSRAINPNLRILTKTAKTHRGLILEGSSRSGKTWSSIDFLIYLTSKTKQPLVINIIKETYNSFKTTLYDDFDKRLPMYGIKSPFADRKEVDSFKLFGSKINLMGADKPSKFHGASCDYFWINESLDISQEIFDQSEMRCRTFWWMDFNPKLSDHWLFERVEHREDVLLFKSTFKDNPHISDPERNKILSYEPVEKNIKSGTADDYMWKVYGLGERCAPEGLIFKNVTWIRDFPKDIEQIYYGIDFGYTNDPTALVKMGRNGNNIYVQSLHYSPTENSGLLIEMLKQKVPNENVWADSADPGMIADARQAGLKVFAVKKFAGSIKYGIQLLNRFKLHFVDCPELRREQANYCYKVVQGIQLNEPIDKFNHCFSGDTKISTSKGLVNIDKVKVNDLVLTSRGYEKVLKTFDNGLKQTYTYTMQLDTIVLSLTCTQDHKIKTQKGWRKICKLKRGDRIYLHRNLTVKRTTNTQAKDIFQKGASECMSLCGSIIKGIFLKGIISIIRIETHVIMTFQTLILSVHRYTKEWRLSADIKKIQGHLKGFMRRELKQQRNGTNPKRGKNGTQSMEKTHGLIGHILKKYVRNVEKNIRQDIRGSLNTAITTARLKQIDVKESKEQQVYDLEIHKQHEYFANNILVHNCFDALRYTAMVNIRTD